MINPNPLSTTHPLIKALNDLFVKFDMYPKSIKGILNNTIKLQIRLTIPDKQFLLSRAIPLVIGISKAKLNQADTIQNNLNLGLEINIEKPLVLGSDITYLFVRNLQDAKIVQNWIILHNLVRKVEVIIKELKVPPEVDRKSVV